MFVAFVSFVLTDRSARRFFYFYLFYLLFDLSIVCSFVYRRFLSLLDLCIFVPFSRFDTSLKLSFDSSFGRSLVGRFWFFLRVLC